MNDYALHDFMLVVDEACTQGEAAKWAHTDIGNKRLRSKIWINNNIFGKHAGSFTESYEKDGGTWKLKKANIRTTISADFRDLECVVVENKSGERNKNNAKKADRSKTVIFQRKYSLANGDVVSTHRLVKGNVTINKTMILNPCN